MSDTPDEKWSWFSNATEGDAWQSVWCNRCVNDHAAHEGRYEDGCALFAISYIENGYNDEKPVTGNLWNHRPGPPFHLPPDVVCTMFHRCHCESLDGRDDEAERYREAVRERVYAKESDGG